MSNIRVWSPSSQKVEIQLAGSEERSALTPTGDGEFVTEEDVPAGTQYHLVVDDGNRLPDPRSMRQPEGAHGPSEVVDPSCFTWTDDEWQGEDLGGKVFYELHIGTFTDEGTFRSAIDKLDHLKDVGVDVIELLPINPMPGERGWGYDGVSIFAIHEPYGSPEDLVALVDAIHARGMSACLDVVYNHFGPDGNYLAQFGPYFTDKHHTPWGEAVNLDGEHSAGVRKYFIDNAKQWLRDYHFDALRLDATDHLVDDGDYHFLAELSDEIAKLSKQVGRQLTLTVESDLNMPAMIRPVEDGGRGMDMQWTDDVHHALHVWLTGENNAYYIDSDNPEAMPQAFTNAFTRIGQPSLFSGEKKGEPVPDGVSGHHFIVFDENHDQVGNRLISDRPTYKLTSGQVALSRALILLSHYTPMLFMGEEWGTKQPFHYFTDHGPEIGLQIKSGRESEFALWDMSTVYGEAPVTMLDPQDLETFTESKLNWNETREPEYRRVLDFVTKLIELRRTNTDIASGDRSLTDFHLDGDGGWMRRGDVLIVFSKSLEESSVEAPVDGRTCTLSWEQVVVHKDAVEFAGPGVAVLTRPQD